MKVWSIGRWSLVATDWKAQNSGPPEWQSIEAGTRLGGGQMDHTCMGGQLEEAVRTP